MNLFKKAAVSLAATSMIAAPVAASAAQGVRAASAVEGQSELEGETSWIVIALAAVGIIAAIVLLTDGDDEPTSP
ncbi:MAG: hypothetical protein JNN10_10075 [Sphingopyxis sp.]|jgi:hypothetical protein|uniref:hypothetical protein n=1 Tax=Sphingopyxis TaxID=165697 RepID=UPI0010F55865|nr:MULTISPECIES: hypothetical protein [Sphingopyxis]MBL9066624.1 hypothetical protein [Sphingopyxis sp.]